MKTARTVARKHTPSGAPSFTPYEAAPLRRTRTAP